MSLKIYKRLTTQSSNQKQLLATLVEGENNLLVESLTPETGYVYTFERESTGKVFELVEITAQTAAVEIGSQTVYPSDFSYVAFSEEKAGGRLQSAFSDLNLTTEATTLTLEGGTTLASTHESMSTITVYVDDVFNQTIAFATAQNRQVVTKQITLPSGAKKVTFRTGANQLLTDGYGVAGTFINKVSAAEGLSLLAPVKKAKRVVVLGDSITVGTGTTRPETKAAINLMRADARLVDYEISSYGWGRAKVSELMGTSASRTTVINNLVNYFAGATSKVLWIELSTNDYGVSPFTSLANLGTYYGAFLDEVKTAIPTIQVFAQTAFVRSNELNASGNTISLQQYRNTLINTVYSNGRDAYTKVIDGASIIEKSDLVADGIHVSDAGNGKIAEFYTREITGQQSTNAYMVTDGALTSAASKSTASFDLITLANWTVTGRVRKERDGNKAWAFAFGNLADNQIIYAGFENDNRFWVKFGGSPAPLQSTAAYTDRAWHKFALRRTGSLFELLMDDVKVHELTKTDLVAGSTRVELGGVSQGAGFPSFLNIDYIRVYNTSLSDASIAAERVNLTDINPTTLHAAWELNGNFNDTIGGNNLIGGVTASFAQTGQPPLQTAGFSVSDGTTSSASTRATATFNLTGLTNWTIKTRARKKRDGGKDWIFGQGSTSATGKLLYLGFESDNTIQLKRSGTAALISPATYTDRNWHEVAVRKTGTLYELFVDGAKVSELTSTYAMTNDTKLHINGIAVDTGFPAILDVDYVRLYNIALANAEIASTSPTVQEAALLAGWEMNADFNDTLGVHHLTPGSTSKIGIQF